MIKNRCDRLCLALPKHLLCFPDTGACGAVEKEKDLSDSETKSALELHKSCFLEPKLFSSL